MHIVIARHGSVCASYDGLLKGQKDIPLAPEGELQVKSLGQLLNLERFAPDLVLSSDLSRCVSSAEILMDSFDEMPRFVLDKRLRERCFGVYEGHPRRDMQAIDPDNTDCFVPCEGESRFALRRRVLSFWEELIKVDACNVLLVTHGGPIAVLVNFCANSQNFKSVNSWPIPCGEAFRIDSYNIESKCMWSLSRF